MPLPCESSDKRQEKHDCCDDKKDDDDVSSSYAKIAFCECGRPVVPEHESGENDIE